MARPRAASGADAPKEPHAVSLKGMQFNSLTADRTEKADNDSES